MSKQRFCDFLFKNDSKIMLKHILCLFLLFWRQLFCGIAKKIIFRLFLLFIGRISI